MKLATPYQTKRFVQNIFYKCTLHLKWLNKSLSLHSNCWNNSIIFGSLKQNIVIHKSLFYSQSKLSDTFCSKCCLYKTFSETFCFYNIASHPNVLTKFCLHATFLSKRSFLIHFFFKEFVDYHFFKNQI